MLTPKEHFINRKSIIEKDSGTQIAFAKKVGISRIGLYKAISCITKSKKMHELICDALPVSVSKEIFWPEFYGPDATNNNVNVDTVSHDATVNDQTAAVN